MNDLRKLLINLGLRFGRVNGDIQLTMSKVGLKAVQCDKAENDKRLCPDSDSVNVQQKGYLKQEST